ncbi:50S ribosomal protein L30 [Candidatus Purcelliella pentastirinorum]|uniref:Large ribosomal subunit protein uL30 n=1 Tax=Candidatus Purcelliella pentastirinorum TaxID=472834 RepID=A0A346DZL2_9ENTR|nr:50S ribosomal protein L30 [Candidatus Purcelliella pentastirinorum]AXN02167.1 50S ribosomal protein L30 [Candidatus Purcelliella pentastirinorum]
MSNKITILQKRSLIGVIKKHKLIILGLGLRGIGHIVKRVNNLSILGMIKKISYLVEILR